jgi:hypothetical protein
MDPHYKIRPITTCMVFDFQFPVFEPTQIKNQTGDVIGLDLKPYLLPEVFLFVLPSFDQAIQNSQERLSLIKWPTMTMIWTPEGKPLPYNYLLFTNFPSYMIS